MADGNLREFRKKAGLTQSGLSELSGVSRPVIARIESGKALSTCKVDTILRLANGLGISPESLMTCAKDAG